MFRNIKIGTKILAVVLLISLLTLLIISVISYTQMLNLTKYSQDANIQLGITASQKSKTALLDQAVEYLQTIAVGQAASSNATLVQISSEVNAMAAFVESLYKSPQAFAGKAVPLPPETVEGVPSAKYILAPGAEMTATVREELRRVSSAEYMFSTVLKNNPILDTTYLGTANGISYRYSQYNAYNRTYDPRQRDWYIAAMSQPDKVIWTDTYVDSYGETCLTCARTYRDGNGRLAGVVAVDVYLTNMVENILGLKLGGSGYAFLLDKNGAYIAHPRYGEEGFDTNPMQNATGEWLRVLTSIIRGEERAYVAEIDGIERYLFSANVPETGWAFCVGVPIQEVIAPANETKAEIDVFTDTAQQYIRKTLGSILMQFIIIFAVSAILVVGFSFALSLTIIKPIEELAVNVDKIGSGDLDLQIPVEGKDEIAELGRAFNKMVFDLKEYIKNLNRITAEKERINGELSVAADIQKDMLPRIFDKFTSHNQLALFAEMVPAKEVGGDFYDFFYLDEAKSKVVFVIADVSGKGVPAALFMVIAKTLIKTHMLNGRDPAAVLEQVNNLLCEDNNVSMFVTVFLCSLDLNTGILTYANGGHNWPLIAPAGEPYQFMELEKGVPIAIVEDSKYKCCTRQLNAGDKLYLYTDGVTEAQDLKEKQWGNDPFLATANSLRNLEPEDFDKAIRNAVSAFVNGAEQFDDITTMAIKYLGSGK